jgi:hypothetical protein
MRCLLMFLHHLVSLHLLDYDPSSDILASAVALRQQVDIVKATLGGLQTGGLSTPAHLEWVLQILGRGLSLPASEASTTRRCLDLYSSWITNEASRPPVLTSTHLPVLGLHLSQVFESRLLSSAEHRTDYHQVLHLLRLIVLSCEPDSPASAHTADTLVRILIGVTDFFLGPSGGSDQHASAPVLSFHDVLLQTALDGLLCFAKHGLLDDGHWQLISSHVKRWRTHERVILKWSSLLRLLTRRFCQVLQGQHSKVPQDTTVCVTYVPTWSDGHRRQLNTSGPCPPTSCPMCG